MSNQTNDQSGSGAPARRRVSGGGVYEIRVKDHLDPCWCQWFEGWSLTNLEDGEFILTRSNVDQSALNGVLNKILDLNLTLLSLTRKDET